RPGGSIMAYSRGPRTGSAFIVRLPHAATNAGQDPAPGAPAPYAWGNDERPRVAPGDRPRLAAAGGCRGRRVDRTFSARLAGPRPLRPPAQESPAALSRVCPRRCAVSQEVLPSQAGAAGLGQFPPLTDWLIALAHESPFEPPQAPAARAGTPPTPAAVPSLLSLLKDDDPDVRLKAAQALGDLAEEVRRVLPALRAALGEAALREEDAIVRG